MMTFAALGAEVTPDDFLRTQRELREQAKLRAILRTDEMRRKQRRDQKLSTKVSRATTKLRLKNRRKRERLKKFIREVRARKDEGYSAAQLLKSYIPDLGGEEKIPEADVTAEVKKQDLPTKNNIYTLGSKR